MKISVLVAVYNVEQYLRECLDSCINQDYPDVEFICVNDGSTDSSPDILREYEKKDSRIKVIDQENKGISGARNTGLKNANGQWVMFLDSDDRLKDGALEIIDRESKSCPEIIVFWADTFPSPIDENPWFKKTLQFPAKVYNEFSPQVMFKERGAMPFVWRHAYSMDLIRRNEAFFNESIGLGEDVIFPMMLFPDSKKTVFIDNALYDYRLGRSGSIMDKSYSRMDFVVDRHFATIRAIADIWNRKGWMELFGPDFLSWALKYTVLKVNKLKGNEKKARAKEMLGMIDELGLAKYKKSMGTEGKAMLFAFRRMG